MKTFHALIVYLFCLISTTYSQGFNNQQKAWLFKVVEKSPCLKLNIGQYFNYTGQFHLNSELPYLNKKLHIAYEAALWDSIEESIIRQPDLLQINWEGINSSSPGVLAETAVKLTLWEIYSNIKEGYLENPKFSENIMANEIYTKVISYLPAEMKSAGKVKDKYESVLLALINPSLNFKRKAEAFSQIKQIKISQKKLFFEKWYDFINSIVDANSKKYFELLAKREIFFSGNLLAVGEGSGSSGLLKEFEVVDDTYMGTGTGKGIGLFTYKVGVHKGNIELESTTETSIRLLSDEPTLLHLSLWGMDWLKKPLVVIERGEKSYLLFGNQDFSPDEDWSKGTSYFDVLVEFKDRKIDKLLIDLNKEGGLLSIYEKENQVKDKIKGQVDLLNAEIDSIKKADDPNQSAIQQRLNKNEVNLSNLSSKEERLTSLQKKISAEYQKIDKAEKELVKMKAVLGKNIQNWTVHDSVFTFDDGTIFNARTQDLILYNDSSHTDKITVRLLAASYSIYSDKKDEVQLYVNVTGGVNDFKEKDSVILQPDTLLNKSFYFNPDEYIVGSLFSENDTSLLLKIANELKKQDANVETSFVAMGVDSMVIRGSKKVNVDYTAKKDQSDYINARRVELLIIKRDKDYYFSVKGYTDPGATNLSKVSSRQKTDFNFYKTKEQTLNPALSILRVKSVIDEIENLLGIDLSESYVEVPVVEKEVKTRSIIIK